jgi:hypothetical protein
VSTYRFVQDCWIGQNYYQAGSQASTADVGGTLPSNFIPSAACDPLDASALSAFYAAGPQLLGRQWAGNAQFMFPPVTYWKARAIPGSSAMSYSLTGLGINEPAICQ